MTSQNADDNSQTNKNKNNKSVTAKALDPNTPLDELRRLAQSLHPSVRAALAQNPSSTVSVVYNLPREYAEHLAANTGFVEKLTENPKDISSCNESLQLGLLEVESLPAVFMHGMLHSPPNIRRKILNRSDVPLPVLKSLVVDVARLIRKAAMQYERVHLVDILEECMQGADEPDLARIVIRRIKKEIADETERKALLARIEAKAPKATQYKNLAEEAADPATSPERLLVLSKNSNIAVQKAVAQNPNTPLDVLQRIRSTAATQTLDNPALVLHLLEDANLLQKFPPETKRQMAINSADESVLSAFGRDHDPLVRVAVAQNPHAPAAVLSVLLVDEHYNVRRLASNHPTTASIINPTFRVLHRLVAGDFAKDSIQEGESPKNDEEWQILLQTSVWTQILAAHHPQLPQPYFSTLCESRVDAVVIAALQNPNIPFDVALRIWQQAVIQSPLQQIHFYASQALAKNPQTPPDILRQICKKDTYSSLATHLAAHPQLPSDVMTLYLCSTNANIRAAAAGNTAARIALYHILAKACGDPLLRHESPELESTLNDDEWQLLFQAGEYAHTLASRHPQCPTKILRAMYESVSVNRMGVRHSTLTEDISRHPHIDRELFLSIRNGPPSVRAALAQNPYATSEDLIALLSFTNVPENQLDGFLSNFDYKQHDLVGRPYLFVHNVVHHPNAPADFLHALATSEVARFSTLACQHPNTPAATLSALKKIENYKNQKKKISSATTGATTEPTAAAGPEKIEKMDEAEIQALLTGRTYGRILLAEYPTTPPDVLAALAENARTAEEMLSQTLSQTLLQAIGRNPNTPKTTLHQFAQSTQLFLREAVAANPNTPEEDLRALLKKRVVTVYRAAATNPNLPADLVVKVAEKNQSKESAPE